MSRNFEVLRRLEMEDRRSRHVHGSAAMPIGNATDATRRVKSLPADARCPVTNDRISAEMKKLVERVFLTGRAEEYGARVVVFAPVEQAGAGNGLCARASVALAGQSQSSVCVVDANLSSPSLHSYFGVANGTGIADSLLLPDPSGVSGHRVPDLDLVVITAGCAPGDWEVLVSSGAMVNKIGELQKDYEYLLIDGAPLSVSMSAAVLGKIADGVVMVVEANSTRRELVKKTKVDLDALGVRVLGTVLNNRDFPIPDYLYKRL